MSPTVMVPMTVSSDLMPVTAVAPPSMEMEPLAADVTLETVPVTVMSEVYTLILSLLSALDW